MTIFYTEGPQSLEIGAQLLEAGAGGARLTFSFSTPEFQLERAVRMRKTAQGRPFEIMADLEGGGARIGLVAGKDGQGFQLRQRHDPIEVIKGPVAQEGQVALPDETLWHRLRVGSQLLIADGLAVVEITEVGERIKGRTAFDCRIEGRRSVILKNTDFEPPCLTEKDRASLRHIAAFPAAYDSVALSFVGSAADVREAREILGDSQAKLKIIAKIETAAGVENIDEICQVVDSVMVARGDLALTCDWKDLPRHIDTVVSACNRHGTPWIMATQVAEGISHGTMMTRAEIGDAWHALERGAAGFLLSHETAWGPRPTEAVRQLGELIGHFRAVG